MAETTDITHLLRDVEVGRAGALDRLMESVYGDLERLALRHLNERFGPGLPGVTLEPAALVNESYLRLIKQRKAYVNGEQFFAIATRVMLRVLLDYQRRRGSARRGGDRARVTLKLDAACEPAGHAQAIEVEALIEALERLEAADPRKANVVRLRVLWGLTMGEIAEALAISVATVERDWAFSRAWLARETADK